MRRLTLALGIVLLSAGLAHAKTVTLAHKFQKGQLDKYRFSMNMTMRMPMGEACGVRPIRMNMSALFRQKVLDVMPDGSARVKLDYSDFKINSPDIPQAANQKMPAQSVVMTLLPDGRVVSVEGMEQFNLGGFDFNSLAGQFGYCSVFPQVPLEIGDRWTNEIPMPFDCGSMTVESTLLSAALPVGKDVAAKVRQTYQAYMDLGTVLRAIAPSFQASAKLPNMDGGVQMTGWSVVYFSPGRGRLVKANGSLQASFALQLPAEMVTQGAPAQINMTMELTVNMARI